LAEEKNNEIQKKAQEIEISRAEAANAEEKLQILEGKITEINSLAKKEINEIQLKLEEMQFAARNKDNEIGRLRAEAVNAKESVLILEGTLLELNFLAKGKNEEIQKYAEEIDDEVARSRSESVNSEEKDLTLAGKVLEINFLAEKDINKIQQNVEEMQMAARNKDMEIGRLQAEAVIVQERVKINLAKLLEINSLAKKENETMQKNVKDMQVAAQNKNNEVDRLRIEVCNTKTGAMILQDKLREMHSLNVEKNSEIQKLKNGQPESLKCKCASSLSNVSCISMYMVSSD
jgi:hypothetical protein